MIRRALAMLVLVAAALSVASGCKGKHAPATPLVDPHKLVIVNASWGAPYDGLTTDVTALVRGKVDRDALSVTATTGLLGDPAVSKIKFLRVEYQKGGVAAKKMVGEGETLVVAYDEKAKPLRLVVTKAVYGDFTSGKTVDVTLRVADLVKDDALAVSSYNALFGDPAANRSKQIRVEYLLDGQAKSKVLSETEPLALSAPASPGR